MTQKKESHVIVLEQELVKSRAWLSLNGTAKSVYLLFLMQTGTSSPNGERLSFTYIDAEKEYEITDKRFVRAIDALINRGFIVIVSSGHGTQRARSFYRLSKEWRAFGEPDFKPLPRHKRSLAEPGFKPGNKNGKHRQKAVSNSHF